jgi:hypothetical protein
MTQDAPFKRLYTCGTHVAGHGRPVGRDGASNPFSARRDISQGIIVMMPSRQGDVYTILDEQTFVVLESREDEITALP